MKFHFFSVYSRILQNIVFNGCFDVIFIVKPLVEKNYNCPCYLPLATWTVRYLKTTLNLSECILLSKNNISILIFPLNLPVLTFTPTSLNLLKQMFQISPNYISPRRFHNRCLHEREEPVSKIMSAWQPKKLNTWWKWPQGMSDFFSVI